LLTFLIEKYDTLHKDFELLEPIPLLKSLMSNHQMKAIDLVHLLQVSPGLVSVMLNYHKGVSKEVIQQLTAYFKVSLEAFNREYKLIVPENAL